MRHVAFGACYKNLTTKQRANLNSLLDGLSFSCSADLQDAQLPDTLVGIVYINALM